MADQTQKQTHGVLGDVKSALKGVKGAGDAIRGTFNESIDTAFHEREGEAKNKAIKEKGIADMEGTDAHFSKHNGTAHASATTNQSYNGTASSRLVDQHPAADAHTVPQIGGVTGGLARNTQLADGTSTGAGAHSGAAGNLESRMPQQEVGAEPAHSTDRN